MELTIEGEVFRVEVEGADDRPVLTLSPSLGTDLSLFDAQMPALLEHFRVVRYDPRGHGRSTKAGAPYALARLGWDVLAILDALAIERTHFLGISMGGAVGQWLLVNAPARLDRVVLANTSARFGPPSAWNERIRTVRSRGMGAIASATMERWFSKGFRGEPIVGSIEATFRATSAEGYAAGCAALRDMDLREAMRQVERPVLVVTGRDDPVTSPTEVAALVEGIAGARHVELDCKHISNIEAQAGFDAAVIAFLTASEAVKARRPAAKPRAKAGVGKAGVGKAAAGKTLARRVAGRATSARSPLKTATTRATKLRRAAPKRASRKAAGKVAPTRRASPGAARGTIGKATARPASKTPAGGKAGKGAAGKAVASKAVTSKRAAAKTTVAERPHSKPKHIKTASTKATPKASGKTPARKGGTPTSRRRPSTQPRRPGGKR